MRSLWAAPSLPHVLPMHKWVTPPLFSSPRSFFIFSLTPVSPRTCGSVLLISLCRAASHVHLRNGVCVGVHSWGKNKQGITLLHVGLLNMGRKKKQKNWESVAGSPPQSRNGSSGTPRQFYTRNGKEEELRPNIGTRWYAALLSAIKELLLGRTGGFFPCSFKWSKISALHLAALAKRGILRLFGCLQLVG